MRPVIEILQLKQVHHGKLRGVRTPRPRDHIDTLFPRCHFRQCGRDNMRRGRAAPDGELAMATRERRLAEFDGAGAPPPGEPVQVLCEDQSGTYQLPFACYFADGQWRNHESGGALEATVIGWRFPRLQTAK
jgi:hypothetical protein